MALTRDGEEEFHGRVKDVVIGSLDASSDYCKPRSPHDGKATDYWTGAMLRKIHQVFHLLYMILDRATAKSRVYHAMLTLSISGLNVVYFWIWTTASSAALYHAVQLQPQPDSRIRRRTNGSTGDFMQDQESYHNG